MHAKAALSCSCERSPAATSSGPLPGVAHKVGCRGWAEGQHANDQWQQGKQQQAGTAFWLGRCTCGASALTHAQLLALPEGKLHAAITLHALCLLARRMRRRRQGWHVAGRCIVGQAQRRRRRRRRSCSLLLLAALPLLLSLLAPLCHFGAAGAHGWLLRRGQRGQADEKAVHQPPLLPPPVPPKRSRRRVASLENGTAEDSPALKEPAGPQCAYARSRVLGVLAKQRRQQRSGSCLLHGDRMPAQGLHQRDVPTSTA